MPYLLPPEPSAGTVCITLEIPDSTQDVRNFFGTLLSLAQWYNYERTGNTLGKQVADTWKITYDNARIGNCMQLRQDPENPCLLQSTTDGETWETWADITDCVDAEYLLSMIESSESLQRAIGEYALTSAVSVDDPEKESILSTDLLGNPSACDNDMIYGACIQLTILLNTVSETLLDIFVNSLNNAANLAYLIEAIPLVGELPADDILEFLQKVATQVNTAYQAAYDTQLQEDISCLFFCEAKLDCELTFEQARDVIRGQMANPVTGSDFISVVNDIIANNWLGEQSIYVFFYFILETVVVGGEVLGQDVNRFAKTIATYFNDPNSDWETLCTDCADWEQVLDFTIESHASLVTANWDSSYPATYVSGQGWKMAHDALGARGGIYVTIPSAVTVIDAVAETYNNVTATNTRSNGVLIYDETPNQGSNDVARSVEVYQSSGEHENQINGEYEDIEYVAGIGGSRNGGSAIAYVRKITIRGLGVNPF